jgi:hypothetical protein
LDRARVAQPEPDDAAAGDLDALDAGTFDQPAAPRAADGARETGACASRVDLVVARHLEPGRHARRHMRFQLTRPASRDPRCRKAAVAEGPREPVELGAIVGAKRYVERSLAAVLAGHPRERLEPIGPRRPAREAVEPQLDDGGRLVLGLGDGREHSAGRSARAMPRATLLDHRHAKPAVEQLGRDRQADDPRADDEDVGVAGPLVEDPHGAARSAVTARSSASRKARVASRGSDAHATADSTAIPAAPVARTAGTSAGPIPPIATTGSGARRVTTARRPSWPSGSRRTPFDALPKTAPTPA